MAVEDMARMWARRFIRREVEVGIVRELVRKVLWLKFNVGDLCIRVFGDDIGECSRWPPWLLFVLLLSG